MKVEHLGMDNKKINYRIKLFGVIAVVLLAMHYLVDLKIFEPWSKYLPFIRRLTMSSFLIALIFLISNVISRLVNTQTDIQGNTYNLMRVVRFLAITFSLVVAVSFMFQNLYAAAVSFGLITLILGFALQAPITSFIAWVYLIFRRTYLVGDRIQIKGMRGDVISITYLDTSILECSGDYLENDRKSGRVISFPNSLVLREEVINYSGPEVPFIWNETPVQIAYTSDLKFVEECLLKAADKDFESKHPAYYNREPERWGAAVYFRVNSSAWMEAVVSYPVEPIDTTGRRNRILREALPKLNAAPEKVQFPEGTRR